jgi:hypothetical protein
MLALLIAAPACGGGSGATPAPDGGPDVPAMTTDGSGHNDTVPPPQTDATGNDPGGDAPIDSQLPDLALDVPRLDGPPPGDVAGTDGAFRLPTMTMEALQVAGTHNSYHQAPIIAFDASHAYTHKPLDQQLNGGVRALELDLHLATDGSFDVYHLTVIDPNSSCPKLDTCLSTIATWSASHPRHVPIVLWFELKDANGGQPINDLVPVEAALLKAFARERIITPAWLRGNHASPRERIMTAGWPTLDEARGKIMFALITRDARTKAYTHDGTSLEDRVMWVNAAPEEFGQPWAVITKDLDQPDQITRAHAGHLLIGVNTCAINQTDDACTTRLNQFVGSGVHLLSDDLPFQISGRNYWERLPGGSPGCNPVTAPLSCAAATLE